MAFALGLARRIHEPSDGLRHRSKLSSLPELSAHVTRIRSIAPVAARSEGAAGGEASAGVVALPMFDHSDAPPAL